MPIVSQTADDMLMVDFEQHPQANIRVRAFLAALQTSHSQFLTKSIRPVAGMHCVGFMLEGDSKRKEKVDAISKALYEFAISTLDLPPTPGRQLEIPVCYDTSFAPDLERLANHCGLSTDEVVQRHCAGVYTAQLIGFLPGFAYLGGLDPDLATPRLSTPRPKVPAGSLGIAGTQCAVYPTGSPGGWNLIGRSPIRFFDQKCDPPAAIQLGDEIRFIPITVDEFERQWAIR